MRIHIRCLDGNTVFRLRLQLANQRLGCQDRGYQQEPFHGYSGARAKQGVSIDIPISTSKIQLQFSLKRQDKLRIASHKF